MYCLFAFLSESGIKLNIKYPFQISWPKSEQASDLCRVLYYNVYCILYHMVLCLGSIYHHLSYDVMSGSDITPCNKINFVRLRNNVHYNVAYNMIKSLHLHTKNSILMSCDK